ncbi:geranylgeranyl transferase type-2 subunit alpha isoform X1 [Zootermopsis nevadensis]|uniref:geranylgeranyl transferase type-2 subunit alpha isoform X1 n=1 Tax=Zootermopsis nevadensis TaxID=136037 RepID=UPI000B8E3536|nr:geranylgeranyl transferase type-2 subunit alpha isoform X1 [Zootermopsis nevadensis]
MMKFKVRLQCSGLDDIYKTHVLENIVLEIILYLVHVHTIAQVHGRVKTKTNAEDKEAKRKEKEKKLKLYQTGIEKAFTKRKTGEYDEESLAISAQLLTANPDITTLWNIRREVLLHFKDEGQRTEDDLQQQMQAELCLIEQCLRANPKSYAAWHHRRWVLDNMPIPIWKQELALCNKYLDLDERNLHCWDYRRFVVERSQVPAADEFEYTSKKILANFSNYSSWHYRSRLLPLIYPDPMGKLPIQERKHKEELEIVQNAAFTDPSDQSAWFYQRWLLGRTLQALRLAQVHVSYDTVCVSLTHSVSVICDKSKIRLELQLNGDNFPTTWKSTNGQQYSHVWISALPKELLSGDKTLAITVSLHSGSSLVHYMSLNSGKLKASTKPQFSAGFSEGITSVLQDELDSCTQLLDLEPDSKWTLLTSVLLMQAVDRHKYQEDTLARLSQLIQVDPHRSGYYKDLWSRYKMEYAFDQNNELDQNIDLSCLNLTALYHCHYLSCVHTLDLSNNNLSGHSLSQLHPLQCCQVLKLDSNNIANLHGMPALMSLQILSLRSNVINIPDEVKYLEPCICLSSVDLSDNPTEKDEMLQELVKTFLPSVKMLNTCPL